MSGEIMLYHFDIFWLKCCSILYPFASSWRPKSPSGAPHEGSEKEVANKNMHHLESTRQMVPEWDFQIVRLVVFSMFFSKTSLNHFWYAFRMFL